jgi:hypothetical protein
MRETTPTDPKSKEEEILSTTSRFKTIGRISKYLYQAPTVGKKSTPSSR